MAYTPTNWKCGDVVTAELLNKLEEAVEDLSIAIDGEGGGSEPLVVGITIEADTPSAGQRTYTLDKTWQEIADAFPNAYLQFQNQGTTHRHPIMGVVNNESTYGVVVATDIDANNFVRMGLTATSADGYPTYNPNDEVSDIQS